MLADDLPELWRVALHFTVNEVVTKRFELIAQFVTQNRFYGVAF